MAAPTFVAEYETAWNVNTDPRTISVTVATGDRLLVLLGGENAILNAPSAPTGGTGFTWTQAKLIDNNDGNNTFAVAYTATAASSQTFTLSVDMVSGTGLWGYTVLRFSGSDGFGAIASSPTSGSANVSGAPSISITTTQANSAIGVIHVDWNAADGTSRTWRTVNSITPTAGNGFERSYFFDASTYTVYSAYYPDAGAIGAKTVGLSAPTGFAGVSIAVEVKGSSSGGGTAYTGSPADTAGGTDSATAAVSVARTVTDGLGISDLPLVQADIGEGSFDPLGGTDVASSTMTLARTQADTADLSDVADFQFDADRAATETIGASDSTTVTQVIDRVIGDALGGVDSAGVDFASEGQSSVGDDVSMSDASVITLDAARDVDDLLGVTDSVTAEILTSIVYDIAIHDALGLVDAANPPGSPAPAAHRLLTAVPRAFELAAVGRSLLLAPVGRSQTLTRVED